MEKRLAGHITISRFSGNGPEYIRIQVIDERSLAAICEVEIGLDQFARALTGLGHVRCKVVVFPDAPIGKVQEHKTERVPLAKPAYQHSPEEIGAVLAPFEVDGWQGRVDDFKNRHCHVQDEDGREYQSVAFIRYAEAPERIRTPAREDHS